MASPGRNVRPSSSRASGRSLPFNQVMVGRSSLPTGGLDDGTDWRGECLRLSEELEYVMAEYRELREQTDIQGKMRIMSAGGRNASPGRSLEQDLLASQREREINRLREDLATAERRLEEEKTVNQGLVEQLQQMADDLARAEGGAPSGDGADQELLRRLRDAEARSRAAEAELSLLRSERKSESASSSQVYSLQAKVAGLQMDLDRKEQEVARLRKDLASAAREKEKHQPTATSDKDRSEEGAELLRRELQDARHSHEAAIRSLSDAEDRIKHLEREAGELRHQLAAKSPEAALASSRVAGLESDLHQERTRARDLQSQLEDARAKSAELKESLQGAQDRAEDLESQLDASRAREAALEGQVASLKAEVAALTDRESATVAGLRAEVEQMLQQSKSSDGQHSEQVQQLEADLEDLRAQLAASRAAAASGTMVSAEELTAVQAQLEESRAAVKTARSEADLRLNEVLRLEGMLKSKEMELAEVKEAEHLAQVSLSALRTTLQAKEADAADVAVKLAAEQQRCRDLELQLHAGMEDRDRMQQEKIRALEQSLAAEQANAAEQQRLAVDSKGALDQLERTTEQLAIDSASYK